MAIYAEYFEDADQLRQHSRAWDDLALNTPDHNPFFESWCLLPALQHLPAADVHVLVVWEDERRETMLGLMPIVVEPRYRGLPIRRTVIWRHDYCFLSTPLVRDGRSLEVTACMLESIKRNKTLPSLVSMHWLAQDSAVARVVSEPLATRFLPKGQLLINARAKVTVAGDYESSFLPNLNKKKRKELKRNRNRLSEQGDLLTLVVDQHSSEDEIEAAIQAFFVLENTGWKHEQGTAIACRQKHQQYFEECLREGIKRGGASIIAMTLSAKTIASIIIFRSATGTHSFTVKIASDDSYQQYSLGSLLILEVTRISCEDPEIVEIDSCAASDHPMINRLWRERKSIANVNITPTNDYRGAIIPVTDYCVKFVKQMPKVSL